MTDIKLPQDRVPSILPESDREWLVQLIANNERKNAQSFAKIDRSINELATDVRKMMHADIDQEKRLGSVERELIASGKTAGRNAGLLSGSVSTAVITIIMAIAQYLSSQTTTTTPTQRQPAAESQHK